QLCHIRDLHSFPTRRSSDLCEARRLSKLLIGRRRRRTCDPRELRYLFTWIVVYEDVWSLVDPCNPYRWAGESAGGTRTNGAYCIDRKSTRLNSSHRTISYAV